MNAVEYLSACKAKLNLSSDYKLAKRLKVPPSLMSKYMAGKNVPGAVVAFRVAEILGDQPAAVIAEFEAERAEKMGKDDEADEWKGWSRKFGGAAASILLALGLAHSPNADARLRVAADASDTYIVSGRKRGKRGRRAGPWDGLKRAALAPAQRLGAWCAALLAPLPALA